MFRRALIVVVVVACGGSKPPPATTKPTLASTADAPPVATADPAPAAPPPKPPEPAPPAKPPVMERLRDVDGKVPGLAGFSITRKPDATRCGGVAIVTTRAKKIAKADEPIASVYKLEFPTGLDFTTKKDASMKKFNAFIDDMMKVAKAALDHYEAQLMSGADDAAKIAAVARIAQINLRLSSLLGRGEIPADVRSGEFAADKTKAYCDTLVEKAEPILVRAEEIVGACTEKAKSVGAGWWNEVCVAP